MPPPLSPMPRRPDLPNVADSTIDEARLTRRALVHTQILEHLSPMNDRISIHPKICHGQACISGTRIPAHQIVRMFAHGDNIETLLGAYSSITREDIFACLDYAA